MGQLIDLTGKRFGRLVVLERAGSRQRGSIKTPCWKCRCDCGNEVIATSAELRTGDCKSCGCLKKEILLNRSVTHGDGHKSSKYYRLYRIWVKIKDRCEKKYDTSYKYYGGR